MTNEELFKQDDFRQQYQLAKETGDRRFGSECKHMQTRNGKCLNCFRTVIVNPTATTKRGAK